MIGQFRVASVFAAVDGNGTGAASAADEEGDSDAEREWWPRVAGAGGRGEVAGAAERADDTNAELSLIHI